MSDEIHALELEAAQLKVQRERLALQREIDSHRRLEKAAQVGGAVADTAKSAGAAFWSLFKFCFIAVGGALIGVLALCVFSFVGAFQNAQHIQGDLGFRFGHFMGSIPDWVYLIVVLVSTTGTLVQAYRTN